MKRPITFLLLNSALFFYAQRPEKLSFFALDKVALTQSMFQKSMMTSKNYIMSLDADRLLAPYLKEAGLPQKAQNYPNWENTGLDGHIGGHYLSSLSLLYASTGDKAAKKRLDYMIDELEHCQNAVGNGYVSGVSNGKKIFSEIAKGDIKASSFGLNGGWVPLYNIHKTYAGLYDAYTRGKNEKAKTLLINLTNWMDKTIANLSDDQVQDMLRSEHGGLNEVFADVYGLTKNPKHLALAKRFSDLKILNPLLKHQDDLTGKHANTQIPKVIGYKRISDYDHSQEWCDAADFFWQEVTHNRSTIIGGNSVMEHFNPVDNFNSMIKSVEGPETCNTYNMLKLSKELFSTNPSANYINYYERALYNHIFSTHHREKGGYVYFTPMRPGHYRVYSQPETSFWCCVGSGLENHVKYGEMIYAHSDQDLYVNLFIPSQLNWTEKKVKIRQENNFPNIPETNLLIDEAGKGDFSIKLRHPDWAKETEVEIFVNGKKTKANLDEKGFYTLKNKWKKGDKISMKMPMHLSTEQLPDKSPYFAFKYGPVVLAARYGKENQKGVFADDSRGGHIANGYVIPMNEMPTLVEKPQDVLKHIQPLSTQDLKFKISGLYPQKQFKDGLELVPFYDIQEERYVLYWPQATQNEIENIQQQRAKEEAEFVHLEKLTVDKIQLGEQQPESDHFFESHDAYASYMEDLHFRDATGWFSYKMRNTDKKAKFLAVKYFDADANRILNIEVNGITIVSKITNGSSGIKPQIAILQIPKSELSKPELRIKISGKDQKISSKIVELRLLTEQP